jgi:hypothetical protein
MNVRVASLLCCLLFAGCGGHEVQFVDAADPAVASKLGITEQDWHDIRQLASQQKDLVIKDAGKVSPDMIEIELKKSDDIQEEHGGLLERFEKKDGHWRVQAGFSGDWCVAKQR